VRSIRWVRLRLELAIPAVLTAAFVVVAALDVIIFPYHEWDALSYGEWSRLIAEHWRFHFAGVGDATYQRPVLYVAQGLAWGIFGFSERLGRAIDLTFGILLLAALFELGRRTISTVGGAVAVLLATVMPGVQRGIASGLTDVPAAAMVALAGVAAIADAPFLLAIASALCVLTKTSTLPALAGLGLACLLGPRNTLSSRVRRVVAPLAAGTAVGLAYDATQAARFHESLLAFIRSGSTGYYATLSAEMRRSAFFGADWLGGVLRTLLLFGVVYALCRVARLGHHSSAVAAWVLAAVSSYVGPLIASHLTSAAVGPFDAWRHAVGYVALLASLAVTIFSPRGPSPLLLARLLVWSAPPFIVWTWSGAYDLRLLSPAWAPLILLAAVASVTALDGARGRLWPFALPAAAALAIAAAAGLENIDGIGHEGWRQVQSSSSGFFDADANRHIVLPQFSDILAAVGPVIGSSGRIFSSDGKFRFYFPGRATQTYPRSCADLRGYQAFVLLTDDDSTRYMQSIHVSADPAHWAACRNPPLTQLIQAGTLVAYRVG